MTTQPKPAMSRRDALRELMIIMADAIKQAGEFGLPSGHLYAMVMGVASLELYDQIIQSFKTNGLITDKGYLLKWIGPR